MPSLAPGDHLCCIYETDEEHRAVLTPYMRGGLERGEKLLYILDARSAETVLGYLRADGLDFEPYLARGQITVLTAADAYSREGAFDPDAMIAMLRAETERALAEGYAALRVTGEMSWALRGLPGSERLVEYESKLNEFFPGSSCLAVCQYDRRMFEPQLLLDVLSTHPIAVVGTEVYDNFYYIPPEEFLGPHPVAARLQDWVENLAERKRAEEALRRRTHDLGERVKELNCLYGISQLVQEPGSTLEEILQGTVELIPPSWQYPETTCARIILDGREFKTANFEQSAWTQTCEATVNGWATVAVEVCYLDERPEADEGPFLKEERNLLNAIAERLGRITERWRAEEALRSALEESERRREEVSALLDGSRAILENRGFDEAAPAIFESCKKITGATAGYVSLLTGDGKENEAVFIDTGGSLCAVDEALPMPLRGLRAEACRRVEPVRDNDFARSEWTRLLPEGHAEIENVIFVPLVVDGKVVGLLGLSNKPRGFTDNDVRLASAFAKLAAVALRESRTAEALRESEGQFRFLAEHTRDIIWLHRFAPEPHFSYASPSTEPTTGYAPEEFYTDPDLQLQIVHPDDRPLYEEFIRSPKSFMGRSLVLRRIRKDGTIIWTEQYNSLVLDESGNVEANIAAIRDISERIRAEEEMERLRSEFLGMVTHELKTPLTAIKGSAATALGSRTPLTAEGSRELFEIIDEQADRLRRLADDILDMTRIEAGAFSLGAEPVDLHEILETARTAFLHGGSSNPLDIQLPEGLPLVNADRQRIVQVATNLLSNAAKFSPPTAPVEIVAEHDAVQVTVHVRDRGRGIPSDQLDHLFRKFSQLHEERGSGAGGIGLGLAISKGIVESHGGRIWAESAGEGKGATFSFTLPAVERPDISAELTAASGPGVRRRGDKALVLAVDDEPQVLRYLRRSLEDAGHEALLTGDPADVANLVEMEQPDVVLLDIGLPGTSGFELLRHIRQFSAVPVIFLTASDRDEHVVRALEMGADDYVKKPFSPSELLARIDVALRRRAVGERGQVRRPFVLGELKIDFVERSVFLEGRLVTLTATEYKLLVELAMHAGRTLTHDQILQRVWGPEYSGETELLRSFVRNLRRKLGDDARHPRFIFSEPRVGYRMPSET